MSGSAFGIDTADSQAASPWEVVAAEVSRALAATDGYAFTAMCDMLARGRGRYFFTGQGRSGLVAQMAAMRFMHLGLAVHVVGEATAPAIGPGDTLVVFSKSGSTMVSLSFAGVATREGAEVVAVTGAPASALAEVAGLVLPIAGAESGQFGGSLFEQVALLTCDAVALELAKREDDSYTQMARRHANLQ